MKERWLKEINISQNKFLITGLLKIVFIINWLPFILYLFLLLIKKEETSYIIEQFFIFLLIYIFSVVSIWVIFYLLSVLSKMKYIVLYEINKNNLTIYEFNIKYNIKKLSKYLDINKIIDHKILNKTEKIDLKEITKVKIFSDKIYIYDSKKHIVYFENKKIIKNITKYLKNE